MIWSKETLIDAHLNLTILPYFLDIFWTLDFPVTDRYTPVKYTLIINYRLVCFIFHDFCFLFVWFGGIAGEHRSVSDGLILFHRDYGLSWLWSRITADYCGIKILLGKHYEQPITSYSFMLSVHRIFHYFLVLIEFPWFADCEFVLNFGIQPTIINTLIL